MKNSRITTSGVNAGSMADIAFLLLIFFLVTTTFPDDEGVKGILPRPCPEGVDCSSDVRSKNVFTIHLNRNNELMANNEAISIIALRDTVKDFIDNNGDASCLYCKGEKKGDLSDNPQEAIISLHTDRQASYDSYIGIQNELVGAYYELRKEFCKNKFQKEIDELTDAELKQLREAYPLRISEADLQ